MSRSYRIVMTAETAVRIAEKTDIGANSWRLESPGDVTLLVVGDDIRNEGWPRHLGLVFVAEVNGHGIEAAMDAAKGHGEVIATFLAASANARVGPVHIQLVYEITPGAADVAMVPNTAAVGFASATSRNASSLLAGSIW